MSGTMTQHPKVVKGTKCITSFFKKRSNDELFISNIDPVNDDEQRPTKSQRLEVIIEDEQCFSKSHRIEVKEVSITSLERDPGLRRQICDYSIDQQDEIRRAYIKEGAYQPDITFDWSDMQGHRRRFQKSWFKLFPMWLEYSPTKHAAFCLACFLFEKDLAGRPPKSNAFIVDGFKSWKKVRNGKKCAFRIHEGRGPCSPHNNNVRSCYDLLNQSMNIDKVINRLTSNEILENRLRLKATITSVRYLAMQGCAFRGHKENHGSLNQGNFLEMVKMMGDINDEINKVLQKAPKHATYTSPDIQKEVLHILASMVRSTIRKEIEDSKFCILVDEARDDSKKEQMALVLRFVDNRGFVQERFFDIVDVDNTSALTLKNAISSLLFRHCLNIQNIRGQGYDGASNMRGQWNGLQALFLKECPYAYYVHCFAHRLQLALVAASRNVGHVHKFFLKLSFIVNAVGASCKRNSELHSAQEAEIAHMIETAELETGRGANQIGTLQRPGDTRWSSHYSSVSSLIKLYGPTCVVLEKIEKDGSNPSIRGDALAANEHMSSYEFVFILHLVKEIFGKTDTLCQALQNKSQDILNAMNLVSCTIEVLQKMREYGWENLLKMVTLFCERHDITIPDLNARHMVGRGRHQQNHVSVEHHYRCDIFIAAIDTQVDALKNRFNEKAVELLVLSSSMEPKDAYKSFKIDDICMLAEKFYPGDFTNQDIDDLRFQLELFEVDILHDANLQNLSTLSDLCRKLVETGKSKIYSLFDRLIRLVLTLPVSTATTERAFSAMKIVKNRLRNKMGNEFLADCLAVYIEREIAMTFTHDSIVEDFKSMKDRRLEL